MEAEISYGVEIDGACHLFTLPIRTVSEGNCVEPWRKRHVRHKKQKAAIALTMQPFAGAIPLPVHVTLKRYAPRSLDEGDNLPMSMKYIRDSVAAFLTGDHRPGRADNDPRITWLYAQEKSKDYYVRIIVRSCA